MSKLKYINRDLLTEVKTLIEAGWVTGEPSDEIDGKVCYCLGGAFAQVIESDPEQMYDSVKYYPIFEEFVNLSEIPKHFSMYDQEVVDWITSVHRFNDENQKEDVLAALDRAIAKIDEQD